MLFLGLVHRPLASLISTNIYKESVKTMLKLCQNLRQLALGSANRGACLELKCASPEFRSTCNAMLPDSELPEAMRAGDKTAKVDWLMRLWRPLLMFTGLRWHGCLQLPSYTSSLTSWYPFLLGPTISYRINPYIA